MRVTVVVKVVPWMSPGVILSKGVRVTAHTAWVQAAGPPLAGRLFSPPVLRLSHLEHEDDSTSQPVGLVGTCVSPPSGPTWTSHWKDLGI